MATVVILPTACSTPTRYGPLSASHGNGGYSEQRIEDNRYRVMFTGNAYTSRAKVENFLLYRAAQLTVQQGFDGFTMITRATDPNVQTVVTRDPASFGYGAFWGPSWRYRRGGFGWRSWDPWGGSPFWGDDVDVNTITSYEASAEILMFHGKQPADQNSFDAQQVIDNLKASVEMPR
jgi:hypothetical protein